MTLHVDGTLCSVPYMMIITVFVKLGIHTTFCHMYSIMFSSETWIQEAITECGLGIVDQGAVPHTISLV